MIAQLQQAASSGEQGPSSGDTANQEAVLVKACKQLKQMSLKVISSYCHSHYDCLRDDNDDADDTKDVQRPKMYDDVVAQIRDKLLEHCNTKRPGNWTLQPTQQHPCKNGRLCSDLHSSVSGR